MIFRRKKQNDKVVSPTAMRGRDSLANPQNPLARRFQPDDEPDTIDLQQPEGFTEEPSTRDLREENTSPERANPDSLNIISFNPETGKCYVQPGGPEWPVSLEGEPVLAPTELRRGDRLRIGDFELQLLGAAGDSPDPVG